MNKFGKLSSPITQGLKIYEDIPSRKPEGYKSHYAVGVALKKGKIKKPVHCQKCGTLPPKGLIAHHPDYKYPLDIIWLCHSCHKEEHPERNYRPAYLCSRCLGPSKKRWQLCHDCLATQEVDGAGYKQSFETDKEEWL